MRSIPEAPLRALALLLLTACGSATPTVDLPPQWDAMEAAIGSGEVKSVDENELQVTYTKAPNDLYETWAKAARAGGWTVGEPNGLPGLISAELKKGDERLEILVSTRGSRGDVLVTK